MVARAFLSVLALVGALMFIPMASSSAAPRPTPTPHSTLLRLRAAAQPTATPKPAAADRVAAGKQIYLSNYCGSCHTLAAAGTAGIFGPSHDHIGTVAAQRIANTRYRGSAKTAAEYIRESIVTPGVYLAPGAGFAHQPMPPFGHLNAKEIDALVFFLLQQK